MQPFSDSAANLPQTFTTDSPCPCRAPDTKYPYSQCCGPYHHGPRRLGAPDALTLMRSRYSAYVLDLIDYLQDTWHPDTRPSQIALNEPGTRWLGLKILSHHTSGDDQATVEFVARVRNPQGKATRMQELSHFVRQQGHWFYVDGDYR